MVTRSLTKELKQSSGKRKHFQKNAGLTCGQHAEECKSIHYYLLVQSSNSSDQGPLHKTRHIETNRNDGEKEPPAHGHRRKFPEHNTNSLYYKIKNWQFGLHKTAKLL